jgi:hypothetical protein
MARKKAVPKVEEKVLEPPSEATVVPREPEGPPKPQPKEMDLMWMRKANAALRALEDLYGVPPKIEYRAIAPKVFTVVAVFDRTPVFLRSWDEEEEAALYAKGFSGEGVRRTDHLRLRRRILPCGVETQKTADDRVAVKVPIPGSQECAIVGEDLNGKRVAIRIPQKVFLAVADALCKGK